MLKLGWRSTGTHKIRHKFCDGFLWRGKEMTKRTHKYGHVKKKKNRPLREERRLFTETVSSVKYLGLRQSAHRTETFPTVNQNMNASTVPALSYSNTHPDHCPPSEGTCPDRSVLE